MTLRIFKARFADVLQLVKNHAEVDIPDLDYKFAYAVLKAQMSVNKTLREACLEDKLTPELLELVMRECGAEEYVHVIHNMSAEEEDFLQLRDRFREIAHLWYK